jgi:2-haloacid dehalogenase
MKNDDWSHTMPYVFDAYGTLFDFNAAIARHRAAAGPDADRFSEIWRQKQIEYTWTLTLAGRYVEFWTLTQRALDYTFERVPSVSKTLRRDLLDVYLKLDTFADARDVLQKLKARGDRTAILSNGSPAMLASAVDAAGIKDTLDAVLSVDAVRMFKPRPEVYALATSHFACKPGDVVFVSSNRWDAMGATAFGFRSHWVNRGGMPGEYDDLPPAATLPAPSRRQRVEDARPAPDALVERGQVELLVRRMHAVVVEREADHERVHAEHALEVADDRDRAAGADGDGLAAPFVLQRSARLGSAPGCRRAAADRRRESAKLANSTAVGRQPRLRTNVRNASRIFLRVLVADQAERHFGHGLGRHHGLGALPV